MNQTIRMGWQDVMSEVERRIYTRQWRPGQLIPNEADLAVEFGCARVTVNRALQALADIGMLDRRRKVGTSVALNPVSMATLKIPVIRVEIEAQNRAYDYQLLDDQIIAAPANITTCFGSASGAKIRHVVSLHSADNMPYVIEARWINTTALAQAKTVSFADISANEWLLQNIPFTHGDIGFGATNATSDEADILGISPGTGLFMIERTTWDQETAITSVTLTFHQGYQMKTQL